MYKYRDSMSKREIIPGYKGIMDLELSSISEEYKADVIKQHYKEIKEYKIEQKNRPSHLRYENTIERIRRQHDLENRLLSKQLLKVTDKKIKHNDIYNNLKK